MPRSLQHVLPISRVLASAHTHFNSQRVPARGMASSLMLTQGFSAEMLEKLLLPGTHPRDADLIVWGAAWTLGFFKTPQVIPAAALTWPPQLPSKLEPPGSLWLPPACLPQPMGMRPCHAYSPLLGLLVSTTIWASYAHSLLNPVFCHKNSLDWLCGCRGSWGLESHHLCTLWSPWLMEGPR